MKFDAVIQYIILLGIYNNNYYLSYNIIIIIFMFFFFTTRCNGKCILIPLHNINGIEIEKSF